MNIFEVVMATLMVIVFAILWLAFVYLTNIVAYDIIIKGGHFIKIIITSGIALMMDLLTVYVVYAFVND